MAANGGTKAILAALAANLTIAVLKFVAYFLTLSSSMLAEAIHSSPTPATRLLLLVGGKRAKREAEPRAPLRLRPRAVHLRLHRLDCAFQRRRPVRAVRGLGEDPAPACHRGDFWWVPLAVLIGAIVAESSRSGQRSSNPTTCGESRAG